MRDALKHTEQARPLNPGHTQRGFLLITAVVLIVIGALLVSVMVFLSATGSRSSVHHLSAKQALFIAGTGLERGIHTLLAPVLNERVSCGAITGDVNLTNAAFGNGRFTVTAGAPFYPVNATALKVGINAAENTVPVNSLVGYAGGGRVLVDREAIDYSEVEPVDDSVCGGIGRAPCLVGAQRGRDGTTAASHVSGTPAGQYQCDLQVEGGVPDLVNVRGKRTLREAVQLQEGWAIGANGTIVRWAGGPAGNPAWAAEASPVNRELTATAMLSYADGWAVGLWGGVASQRPLILYWDGSNWITRNSNLNINQDLYGINCVATDDCWAVGTAGGATQRPLILYWNGATWGIRNSNLNINQDLYDIYCASSNDCWAVGTAGGAANERPLILHWDNTNTWSRLNSGLNINEDLNSVYCVSWDDCWAVGTRGNGASQRPLILHWNGTAWSPNNSNLNINEDLNSVHCVTGNDCWAVGASGGGVTQRPLILHWDGTAWSTNNSNLNINQDLMAVQILGARFHPQAAWREVFP